MQHLMPLEPGVVFWGERDTLAEIRSLGVRCGQLVTPGGMPLNRSTVEPWKADDFTIVAVFAAYQGEDYADIPTVQRTVGFIPPGTRAEREARTLEVSDMAAALGVPGIATHVGFVPEDDRDENYIAVREMVRRVCDHAAKHGQT